ncbi:DynW-associated RiPP peptide [Vitreimonas flagellata]|uniref:DynW-associated RiPP peptide n=1 Tax=Vitreimonas flagellata TaxID=2560861 RepID=UPI0010751B6B|nr:DynW-associated RiPP peptide [Vitreimonas flagellata]
MAREISLSEAEMTQLEQDLASGKLTGPAKVIARTAADQARAARGAVSTNDVGWDFQWTYRF